MRIIRVDKDGVCAELGIKAGDRLVGFDNAQCVDMTDYEFYNSQEDFVMSVEDESGVLTDYQIEKYDDEDLGLEFEDSFSIIRCKNKCVFCFVDQLPKNVRRSLRVKDDDYRLSQACGNYVTMTNLSDYDMQRILRYRLSPLYISVHSTDDKVRRMLLGNKNAPPILEQLKRFSDARIQVHAQIVYCPAFNDDYERSLIEMQPYCASAAIVPVGLTAFKNPAVNAVLRADAERVIDTVERLQKRFLSESGTRFAFAADEMYLIAQRQLPSFEEYEDFCQIENGVGLIASFLRQVDESLLDLAVQKRRDGAVTLVTGVAAKPFLEMAARRIEAVIGGTIRVVAAKNTFFGGGVDVAGLLTGGCIEKCASENELCSTIIIPRNMLAEKSDVFLDGMTLDELSARINRSIVVCASGGEDLAAKIIEAFDADK